MKLLQITEPGAPQPAAQETAVGIDLGTTHSLVAVAREGKVEMLSGAGGGNLLPSVVRYDGGKVEVGAAQAEGDVIASVKRLMGRNINDIKVLAGKLPFQVEEREGGLHVWLGGAWRSPVEISAEILRALKQRAEDALGESVSKAVITVPAYFDDAARTATRDAARLAGLEPLRLLAEPTAAALAYGLDKGAEGMVAVFDLGGGTFDISLLKLEKGVFQVLATGGDAMLGGDDFDHALAEHALRALGIGDITAAQLRALLAEARRVKEALSRQESETFAFGGKSLSVTRQSFEELTAPLMEKALEACARTVEDAGLAVEDIHAVALVGGSTRMPLVRRAVEKFFKRTPLEGIHPDEVVAAGAALQAEALTRGSSALLLDVTPLSLGVEIMGGLVERLILRNTPIPAAVTKEFTTHVEGQAGMKFHIVQGERELAADCRSLARFELKGIPPLPAGAARVAVQFMVDADGLLTVSAREKTTGVEQHVEVKPSYGLSEEQVAAMLKEAMANAKADLTARLLLESRLEAEQVLAALAEAMEEDKALLEKAEKEPILAAMDVVRTHLLADNRDALHDAVEALEKTAEGFLLRRVNHALGKALKGKRPEEARALVKSVEDVSK